jgi:hypothetical protein
VICSIGGSAIGIGAAPISSFPPSNRIPTRAGPSLMVAVIAGSIRRPLIGRQTGRNQE